MPICRDVTVEIFEHENTLKLDIIHALFFIIVQRDFWPSGQMFSIQYGFVLSPSGCLLSSFKSLNTSHSDLIFGLLRLLLVIGFHI